MTTEANVAPVRFKDSTDKWRDIDLTMQRSSDGSVAPRGHKLGLQLGKRSAAAGGLFASAEAGAGRQVQWMAPWPLPEPTIEGTDSTKARYADVQPGVDLVVDARRSGFEQDFIVKSRPASAPVWRIPLRTKGLTAKPQADGSIQFVDAQDTVRSVIPVAYMWDSVIDPASGDPANRAKVNVTVEQQSAGKATLVIAPDAQWLLDPSRVFPVTVDPTYAQWTVYTNFDTYVQSDVSTDLSNSSELRLGSSNSGATKARTYLNFSLDPSRDKKVMSATLNLWETYSSTCTPTTFNVSAASPASTSTRWTSQPNLGAQYGSLQVAKGFSASCPSGKVSVPVTGLVQMWSANSSPTGGVALIAANENDSGSFKKFHATEGAYPPNVVFTYDRAPSQTAAPQFASAVSYAAPGGSSLQYTPYLRPSVSSTASDADANQVRYFFEFHDSMTVSGTSLKASCGSVAVASGTRAGCTPVGDLPNNTQLYVRSRAGDMDTGGNVMMYGNWSGWTPVRTAATNPTAPTVSCPTPYTNGSWADTAPTADITCIISVTTSGSSYSVPGYFRLTVDNKPVATNFAGGQPGQVKVTPPLSGGTTSTTVTIAHTATSGLHTINATSESPSGRLSSASTYGFGWGGTALSAPVVEPRIMTTGGVKIAAAGPPKGASSVPTAQVRWRISGYDRDNSELVGWNTATTAPLTVTDNGAGGIGVSGIWDAAAETQDALLDSDPNTTGVQPTTLNDRLPVLIDLQVCLVYSSATQCTWSQQHVSVQRVPHAFGHGFPTADAGPGQVALWTGEFNLDATDIEEPGYTGSLSLSRSHATYAGATNTVTGVFGPGWTAQFDGAEAGAAGMQVIDHTRTDSTIALVDGDGTALVWESPNGQRRTTATYQSGTWVPADEDTDLDGSKLTVTGSGTSTTISYIEDDGTITIWKPASAPTSSADTLFRPDGIAEPGVASQTTYSYDGSGHVSRILAPAPPGVTCPATGTLNAGCRALRLVYGTTGTANGRLIEAWLDIYNPAKTGGAGMDSIKVATYTYDTNGRLATVADPRSGLTTSYSYNASNLITSQTPPGQTPYQFDYVIADGRQKLTDVKRDRPAGDPTGGTATLASFVYDVPVVGAGLPDLSASSVARWNQASAPTKGFAAFGPDHPAPATPGEADWPYANLQYTDANGYTVNTADYGAGAWQHTATDYNAQGTAVRELDERALRLVIDGQVSTGAVDQYATQTVYNPDVSDGPGVVVVTPAGTLVTDTYGPARNAALANGTVAWVRPHTHTEFDQGAPNSGINPATTQPYRLITAETTSAYDPGTGTDLETTSQTLTDYTAPIIGDADGWDRSLPGKVTTDVDLNGSVSTGDIVKVTRYDAEGRSVETRQPASNGTDAGNTKTVYYTAAANSTDPTCGSKPQWAGLVCKTKPAAAPASPAGQPATPAVPTTETTAYNYLLAPTTEVETAGTVTRTTTTSYDLAGRTTAASTTVTGLTGSTPNTKKESSYDPTSGQPTVVTARNADNTVAGTVTTGYDAWGRTISYQSSGETATTTVYDAAGQVATVTDANGSTSYTYDGNDANGHTEHRGLATRVDVTVGTQTWTSLGGYDADSSMVTQKLPGGITQTTTLDNAGEPTGLVYTGQVTTLNDDGTTTVDPNGAWLGWSQDNDTSGRAAREWTPLGTAFTGPPVGSDPNDPGDAKPFDRSYSYDTAGRLTQVRDRTAAPGVDPADPGASPCTTRSYGYDRNDNRLSKSTATVATGPCATSGGTTITRAFDTTDRPTTGANGAGTYAYDLLGRTTTLPASDAPVPASGDITLAYYNNDLAKSITQAGATTSYALDALDRRTTETISGGTSTVRHYTDAGDNPTWVTQGANWQRYAELIGGDLALTVDNAGSAELTLANAHGDIVTTVPLPAADAPATALDSWSTFDEFGTPGADNTTSTGPVDYGWLGSKQRAVTQTGLSLMGVRLYNPVTGLFSSMDPVEGGNANAYTYPSDPLNSSDLTGEMYKSDGFGAAGGRTIGANRRTRGLNETRGNRSYGDRTSYRSFRGGRGFYRKRRGEFANSRTSCRRNSFTPETLVLMSDGSSKPISQMHIGDLVLATDLRTGNTGPFSVIDVIIGDGAKHLVDIAVDADADGNAKTVTATDQHPIYDIARRAFVDASELTTHSLLRGHNGRAIRVKSIATRQKVLRVYNLTVAEAHTFYVSADGGTFLTHNCAMKKRKWLPKTRGHISEWRHYRSEKAARNAQQKYWRRHRKFGCYPDDTCGIGGHVHVRYVKKGKIWKTIHFGW